MHNIFRNLFDKKNQTNQQAEEKPTQAERPEPRYKLGNGFYWEYEQSSNGMGGYHPVNA